MLDNDCSALTQIFVPYTKDPHCGDVCDNCKSEWNPDQKDSDNDGIGDVCDPDIDGDGCLNSVDLNPSLYSPDSDNDGVHNDCDNCLTDYNPDQADADSDTRGNVCDNCWSTYNKYQADTDGDCKYYTKPYTNDPHCGDPCDNCPQNDNQDQKDRDNDHVGDACDCSDGYMGPNEAGADCGGVCTTKCGGSCIKALVWMDTSTGPPSQPFYSFVEKTVCFKDLIPILKNGKPADKIDIVLMPDTDYNGNMAQFLKDAKYLIEKGYLDKTAFGDYSCKFNFYYWNGAGDYVNVCQEWDIPWELQFSEIDSIGILFTSDDRACTQGGTGVFSTDLDLATPVHETSHAIVGLYDEYCCDGGYVERGSFTNIYTSLANCKSKSNNAATCYDYCPKVKCWPGTAAQIQNCKTWFLKSNWPYMADEACDCTEYAKKYGLDDSQCKPISSGACSQTWQKYFGVRGVTDFTALTVQSPNWCNYQGTGIKECCGQGWWKSDADTCRLNSGGVFEPDCRAAVADLFSKLPSCTNPGGATAASLISSSGGNSMPAAPASLEEESTTKVVSLSYHMKGDEVTFLGAAFAYENPPNNLRTEGDFIIRELSSAGKELAAVKISDPRLSHLLDHENFGQGMVYRDDVSFTVILPFLDNMRLIEVVDPGTQQVLNTVDAGTAIISLCKNVGSVDPQCQASDLDNDGVLDTKDNCPLAYNPGQRDFDRDSLGDLCDQDADGDGVMDNADKCLWTTLPEVFAKLNPNHYGDLDGDRIFEVGSAKGYTDSTYTIKKTSGCSCQQILAQKPGNNEGEKKFGCTKGTIDNSIK
jgi:hypothetical protein